MLLSLRRNGLTSLFKEVRVFKGETCHFGEKKKEKSCLLARIPKRSRSRAAWQEDLLQPADAITHVYHCDPQCPA